MGIIKQVMETHTGRAVAKSMLRVVRRALVDQKIVNLTQTQGTFRAQENFFLISIISSAWCYCK